MRYKSARVDGRMRDCIRVERATLERIFVLDLDLGFATCLFFFLSTSRCLCADWKLNQSLTKKYFVVRGYEDEDEDEDEDGDGGGGGGGGGGEDEDEDGDGDTNRDGNGFGFWFGWLTP